MKDEEGFPSFSLINKVTGEAIKHSIGATHPVSYLTTQIWILFILQTYSVLYLINSLYFFFSLLIIYSSFYILVSNNGHPRHCNDLQSTRSNVNALTAASRNLNVFAYLICLKCVKIHDILLSLIAVMICLILELLWSWHSMSLMTLLMLLIYEQLF